MTAEEATKLSADRKPIIYAEQIKVNLKEIRELIERNANNGFEGVYGDYNLSYILLPEIKSILEEDGYYVSVAYGQSSVTWGSEVYRQKEYDRQRELELSQPHEPKQSFIKQIWNRIIKTILGG